MVQIKAPTTFITGNQNWCSDNSGTPYRNLWAGKYSGYASTSGTSTASSLTSKTTTPPDGAIVDQSAAKVKTATIILR